MPIDKPRYLYEELTEEIGQFRFAPLVSARFEFTAALNITFLRPGRPGQICGTGGDIDNRIKTLLDSLAKPPHENQIPRGDGPTSEEDPFRIFDFEDWPGIFNLSLFVQLLEKRHDLRENWNGERMERAKGFEPSTFTLAR